MMRTYEYKNVATVHSFTSLAEIPPYLKNTPRTSEDMATSEEVGRMEWFGHATFQDTISLVEGGWIKGAKEAQRVRQADTTLIPAYTRIDRSQLRACHGGGVPIVPRAVQGHPLCYRRPVDAPRPWQTLDLWIAVNAPANITGEQLILKGVGAVALVDALELRRIRVKLTVFSISKAGERLHMTACVVKKFADRLQLHQIAFPLAHPSYFRRLIFGCRERQPSVRGWDGYGRSYSYATKYDIPKGLLPASAAILLPQHDYTSAADAYLDMVERLPMDKVI